MFIVEAPIKIFLVFILALVVVGFVLAFVQDSSIETQTANQDVQDILVLGHSYFADSNTYSGSYVTPTACYRWKETDIEFLDSQEEQIKLILETQKTADDCQPVELKNKFTFLVPSSPEAELVAVELNGKSVNFKILND